jgi:predicted TPR repeat methyltransferase
MEKNWMLKGLAHYEAEEWDDAAVALERELSEHPRNVDAWYKLGNVRTEQRHDQEAANCFAQAIEIDPGHARSWNNFGAAQQRLGRTEQALRAYEEALQRDPALMEPYLNLGRLCEGLGELERAVEYLRAGVEHHPGHPMLTHLLAAARRENPGRVPREHVVAFFDDFAPHFDAQLARLRYRLPQVIAGIIGPRLATGERVLDLGCGTGLMAAALAAHHLDLTGVDLSPRMLEIAEMRGGYSRLVRGDLEEVLVAEGNGQYRAVLAADVFIYIGELAAIFRHVTRVLAPGGLFALSIERIDDGEYHLHPTGRFGHSLGYIERLARENGMLEVATMPVALERRGSLEAQVILLERLDDHQDHDREEP